MSYYSKILLKMNSCFSNVYQYFEFVVHPAAGKNTSNKTKKRNGKTAVLPKATPDSHNLRDGVKRADSYRRNPAP